MKRKAIEKYQTAEKNEGPLKGTTFMAGLHGLQAAKYTRRLQATTALDS